jgi:hypothetical protein
MQNEMIHLVIAVFCANGDEDLVVSIHICAT